MCATGNPKRQPAYNFRKSHSIAEKLTYNVDKSIDDETAATSRVKNSKQINIQSKRGGGHVEGVVKNFRPWKLRSSNASS